MSGRRSNPPLFEVLAGSDATPAQSPKAASRPPADRSASTGVRVSTSGVYLAITAVLVLGVVVWTVAFRVGWSRGQDAVLREWQRAEANTAQPQPPRTDPLASDPAGPVDRAQDQPEPITSGSPALLGRTGPLATDPRSPGNNYLKLATGVGGDEAAEIVRFLAQQGVGAIAVRTRLVDQAPQGVNNPSQYDLYSLLAIPSDRYSKLATRRQQHERQVRSLGSQWQSQHRGTVNFARPQWEKFKGPD